MRIYLHLTPNTEIVPFNYQESLVGAFHRWLGPNELHDDISLYSLSWLEHGQRLREGLDFPNGSTFWISAQNPDLLADLIQGVFNGHQIRWGMSVREVTIQRTPTFGGKQRFIAQSPILIKRKRAEGAHQQFYYPTDPEANQYLTEIMQKKLSRSHLPTDVSVRFDPDYPTPRIKKTRYKNIDIKGTLCPVIVEGAPEVVAFAWEVGVGNSTGIGFGALR
ncbi:MAG: CRISPR-associated endoribonuclease Cas6 [Lewinellaceae bacterium]|nr:CRISPR-associated endoribonuclease Cas6 [Lewinellaceae bacterium]